MSENCFDKKMKRTTDLELRCNYEKRREVILDFLYLDLNTCERCKATGASFDLAVTLLLDIFKLLDFHVEIHKINVTTKELAEQYHFISSPTIRVNGIDICDEVKENRCQDCGDLCGETVDCRIFIYQGEEYEEPPVAMIVEGILEVVFGHINQKEKNYQLPDNLKRFFSGKDQKNVKKGCC